MQDCGSFRTNDHHPLDLLANALRFPTSKMLGYGATFLSAAASLIAFALWKMFLHVRRLYKSPLRNLPGPPNEHWFYGNLKVIHEEDNSVPQERWASESGSQTIMYRGFMGVRT